MRTREPEFRAALAACREARKRASKRGFEYTLTRDDVSELWRRSGGCCEMTRIKFESEAMVERFERRPFAPSLDRLDNAYGYTFDNVRLVCVIVNIAMNTWGEHALMRVAVGMFENRALDVQRSSVLVPGGLPIDVRLMVGKRVRYAARAREPGREVHLGMFDTVQEAVNAQLAWARANSSLIVLRKVYAYTKIQGLLPEINELQRMSR